MPTAEDLLKSFNLNKNSKGDFSLDYQLGTGVSADNVLDPKMNTSNIYLYSSETSQTRGMNEALTIQDGQLKVNFNNTESEEVHSITVLDDDIKTRGQENENLQNWGVSGNGDGTFDLNFAVTDGVGVDFIYDGDRNVYEVRLTEDANATQAEFVQTFTKEEGIALNIEFVNNVIQKNAQQERKPKLIIE